MADTEIIQRPDISQRICPNWNVILLNDDVHSMPFVVELLMVLFRKDYETAVELTLEIHHAGSATIVTVSKERAQLYEQQVAAMREGSLGPLGCTIEPAE